MKKVYIGVNIDWSESFVDPNGAFYCNTTEEQKSLVAQLMPYLELVVNTTDFHSVKGKEFSANGGMWPYHNVAEFRDIKVVDLGLPAGTTISPEQTQIIDRAINKKESGIVVARHVYFQDGQELSFTPEIVEKAFNQRIIDPVEFIKGGFTYIISPKVHFDATTLVSPRLLPKDRIPKVPDEEYTIFDLIEEKYAEKEIVYIGTGVVDNICRHYTTTSLRGKYHARVINIIGATTQLYNVGLGFNEKHQARVACERIQRDIGIEHKTLDEMLEELEERI